MDASRPIRQCGWMVPVMVFVVGCQSSQATKADRVDFGAGPIPDWMTPADKLEAQPPAAPVARGQAPDGPVMQGGFKVPEGKLILNLPPDPLAEVLPEPTTRQASFAQPAKGEAYRAKQIQIAAFIGTETVITDDEVWSMVRQRAGEYLELEGSDRDRKERLIYKEELRRLIERELIVLELIGRIRKNSPAKVDELYDHAKETATRRLTDFRKARKIPTEEEFGKVLTAQGLTFRGLRRQIERDTLVSIYLEQTIKDKSRNVTLNDIWDYYLANSKEFGIDEKIVWLDLFVDKARFASLAEANTYAEKLWKEANTGVDFVQLVKTYGQGDSNLRAGEGIGTKKGEIQPAEMEPTILSMDVGTISPLLRTGTGFHIVKIAEKSLAGVKPFDGTIQAEIRAKLSREIYDREYRKAIDELWRKHRPHAVEP